MVMNFRTDLSVFLSPRISLLFSLFLLFFLQKEKRVSRFFHKPKMRSVAFSLSCLIFYVVCNIFSTCSACRFCSFIEEQRFFRFASFCNHTHHLLLCQPLIICNGLCRPSSKYPPPSLIQGHGIKKYRRSDTFFKNFFPQPPHRQYPRFQIPLQNEKPANISASFFSLIRFI